MVAVFVDIPFVFESFVDIKIFTAIFNTGRFLEFVFEDHILLHIILFVLVLIHFYQLHTLRFTVNLHVVVVLLVHIGFRKLKREI